MMPDMGTIVSEYDDWDIIVVTASPSSDIRKKTLRCLGSDITQFLICIYTIFHYYSIVLQLTVGHCDFITLYFRIHLFTCQTDRETDRQMDKWDWKRIQMQFKQLNKNMCLCLHFYVVSILVLCLPHFGVLPDCVLIRT